MNWITPPDPLEEFADAMRHASPHGSMQNECLQPWEAKIVLGGTAAIMAALLVTSHVVMAINWKHQTEPPKVEQLEKPNNPISPIK